MSIIVHHIPICPFCQRLEILLELKGATDRVQFEVVDVTVPRSAHILALTGNTTALPVMELPGGRSLKESLVLMDFIEDTFDETPVRRADPYERAVENLMVTMEGPLNASGYTLVLNQDPARRDALAATYLDRFAQLDAFLRRYSTAEDGPWLFDRFGWAEAVYTPFLRRFSFVSYYEGVELPADERFARVRTWAEACLAHPAAQQVPEEAVIKLYYDYARGAGNGALVEGRTRSSFVLEPHWPQRPMPPADKYGPGATDEQLGLL